MSGRPQDRLWVLGWEDRRITWGERTLPLNRTYSREGTGSMEKRSGRELRPKSGTSSAVLMPATWPAWIPASPSLAGPSGFEVLASSP